MIIALFVALFANTVALVLLLAPGPLVSHNVRLIIELIKARPDAWRSSGDSFYYDAADGGISISFYSTATHIRGMGSSRYVNLLEERLLKISIEKYKQALATEEFLVALEADYK